MPSWPAIGGWSSMFILTSLTLPPAALTAFSSIGVSCLQGPHQGAQKSTSTGWRRDSWMTSAAKAAVVVSLMTSPAGGGRIAKRDFRRCGRGSTILHGGGILAAIAEGPPNGLLSLISLPFHGAAGRRPGATSFEASVSSHPCGDHRGDFQDSSIVPGCLDEFDQVRRRDRCRRLIGQRMRVDHRMLHQRPVEHDLDPARRVVDRGRRP